LVVEILFDRLLFGFGGIVIQHHLITEQLLITSTRGSRNGRVRKVDLRSQNGVGIIMSKDFKPAKAVSLQGD